MAEGRNNDEMYNESELKDDKKNVSNLVLLIMLLRLYIIFTQRSYIFGRYR